MLDKEIKLFNEYVSHFDTLDDNIIRKHDHSLRVMNHSISLAKSLELSEKDIYLAGLIGLLHDIGRFHQWATFHTYNDLISVDHGHLGVELLKNNNYIKDYITNEDDIILVLTAIENHNKFKIEPNLDDRTNIFCKIIRDADKIDIMEYQLNEPLEEGLFCSENFVINLERKELFLNAKVNNKADLVIRMLCFIFDLNYNYALNYVIEKHLIERKLDLLKGHVIENIDLEKTKDDLIDYIKKRSGLLWQEEGS